MTFLSPQSATVTIIDPFRFWCARLNPQVFKNWDIFPDQLVAPKTKTTGGSYAREEVWKFPTEWFPSGPDRLCFTFDVADGTFARETTLMIRQYAVALMCQRQSQALATIKKKVDLAMRLLVKVASEKPVGAPLASISFDQLSAASSALVDNWAIDSSDRYLLNTVVGDIAKFRKAGWLSDGFCNEALDQPLTSLPLVDRQHYFEEIKKSARVEGTVRSPSQRGVLPVPKAYIDAMLPIGIFLIEDLSSIIIENFHRFCEIRDSVTSEKGSRVCKKVLGRTIATEYKKSAAVPATDDYAALCEDHRQLTGRNFSLSCYRDLFAEVANLQMACYQASASLSAVRAGEMHSFHPDGINRNGEGVLQLHGRIRKGVGSAGFRRHAWTVDELVHNAIHVQWNLFDPVRGGDDHLWCQTAPGVIGSKMRNSSQLHLKAFVQRNNLNIHLEKAGISHTAFRKAWAKLMYLAGLSIADIGGQFGHKVKELGKASVTMNYVNRDPYTRAEKRLQADKSAYSLPPKIIQLGRRVLDERN
jgi:hypothetical protein